MRASTLILYASLDKRIRNQTRTVSASTSGKLQIRSTNMSHGPHHISISRFEKFSGDQPGGYYLQQAYTHGTKCWNGPERSVHVSFECGADNEILEVTEPEKCEYKYRMRTPAVCPLAKEKHDAVEAEHVHEEL